MSLRTLLATLLWVGVPPSTAPLELAFHPGEKSQLAKTFTSSLSFQLDELRVEVDGNEIDPAMLLQGVDPGDLWMQAEFTIGVADTYVAVGDGRPLELVRSFDRIALSYSNGMGDSSSEEDDDALIGTKVLFRWNADDELYERSFVDGDGPEEELEHLHEDMDLRDLLPPSEDAETWTLMWREHLGLVMPGYDVGDLTVEDFELDSGEDAMSPETIDGLLGMLHEVFDEAQLTCTLDGERDVDGRTCAVLTIESKIERTLDLTALLVAQIGEVPDGLHIEQFGFDLTVELAGELLWDVEGGHFHGFVLEGDLSLDFTGAMTLPEEMGGSSLSMSMQATGEVSRKAEAQ